MPDDGIPYEAIGRLAVEFGEVEMAMRGMLRRLREELEDPDVWEEADRGKTVGAKIQVLESLLTRVRAQDSRFEEVFGSADYAWVGETPDLLRRVVAERNSVFHRVWIRASEQRSALSARTLELNVARSWEPLTEEEILGVAEQATQAGYHLWAVAELVSEIVTTLPPDY